MRTSIENLPPSIGTLPRLEEISIGMSRIKDLSPLVGIQSLRKIRITNANVNEIPSGFDRLQLTDLNLNTNPLASFANLSANQLKLMLYQNAYNHRFLNSLPASASSSTTQSCFGTFTTAFRLCAGEGRCVNLHALYNKSYTQLVDGIHRQNRDPTPWEYVRLCHEGRRIESNKQYYQGSDLAQNDTEIIRSLTSCILNPWSTTSNTVALPSSMLTSNDTDPVTPITLPPDDELASIVTNEAGDTVGFSTRNRQHPPSSDAADKYFTMLLKYYKQP